MRLSVALFLVCVALATAAPSLAEENRLTLPAGVKQIADIVYARVGGTELHMDINLPEKMPDKPLPVVVWIHGGGWKQGTYKWNRSAWFVKHGYAAASIQYRFIDEAIFPAQIHDCKAAIRFLRANASKYGIDPSCIGVWGGSAGGHLAALLGTSGGVKELETNWTTLISPAACKRYANGTALTIWQWASVNPNQDARSRNSWFSFLALHTRRNPRSTKLASPITHVTADDPRS